MLAGLKSLLQKPKWRTWLFVSFVLLLYWTRVRPPDRINDFKILHDYGFLAMGKTGVAAVNLSDRGNPTEITVFNTYGIANNLEIVDDLLYVADGPDGLKILTVEHLLSDKVLQQTASQRTPGRALDVAVRGENAFVIDSNAGLVVYKIGKKGESITEISRQKLEGKLAQIVISGNRAFISNQKNRLLIYDLSSPKELSELGYYDVAADINRFVVDGNILYIATQGNGLVILDVSNPAEITVKSKVNKVKNAYDVALRGDYAYVASGGNGFYVLDKSSLESVTDIGQDASAEDANCIQVLDQYVFVADDLNGLRSYLSPVEFTFRERDAASSRGLYEKVAVKGDYAYIAAGEVGLKVVNVSNPSAPVSVPFEDGVYISDDTNANKKVHDFATSVYISGDYLYVTYRIKGLIEYNIADKPENPINEGVEASIPGEASAVVVRGRQAYVASGSAGFSVVDYSKNITAPSVHTVETRGNASGVFVLDDYAYVADGQEGFQIISIGNPEDPRLAGSVNTPGEAVAIFVAKQVDTSGATRTYAFVADGSNGMFIADVTDYNNPVEVARYQTKNYVSDVIVQDNTAFLAEREDGLVILDISKITEPKPKGNQDTPGEARGIFLKETTAFVADGNRGLRIIDIKDQAKPHETGFLDIPRLASVMVVQAPYAYMVDGKEGLWILDLADPGNPLPVSFYKTPGEARNLAVSGSRVYIADWNSGLQVLDVSNPQKPVSLGEYKNIQNMFRVVVQNNEYAYVISEGQKKLFILDIRNLKEIKEVSSYNTVGNPLDLGLYNDHIYLVEGESGLEIINVEDPKEPTPITLNADLGLRDARAIWVAGERNHIFIADGQNGLKTFSIASSTPSPVFSSPLDYGIANSLTVEGNYLFMSVTKNGVMVFDIYDVDAIHFAGHHEPYQQQDQNQEEFLASSISAVSEAVTGSRRFIVYVPTGVESDPSLQVFQADGKAKPTGLGMYESPGEASFGKVVRSLLQGLVGFITQNPMPIQRKVWVRLGYICFGPLLFFSLSALWLVLLAQFVLPVQTVKDGYKAATRLLASIRGRHGPVVFVREGNIVHRPGELDRPGPGVARVDLNSAIVLEKRALMQPRYRRLYTKYVRREQRRGRIVPRARVEAPGVVFIEPYESIHGVADLRSQFRLRPGIRAYTRDGIEVSNPVWILFTLGQAPEVLDVTYEGERKAENLRVVQLGETNILARESIQHLDEKHARIYERYQRTRRFFQKAKERASLDIVPEEWVPSHYDDSYVAEYIARLKQNVDQWDLSDVSEIREFIREIETQVAGLNIGDPDDVELLIDNINTLAGRALNEAMTEFYGRAFQGRKKQRGLVVKSLSDELDAEDREEIHRYVQQQTAIRYFAIVKDQASRINYGSQASDGVLPYLRRIARLANRWGIHDREDVLLFLDNVSLLLSEIEVADPQEGRWFAYHVCVLADEISAPAMSAYYEALYPDLVARYQDELRNLMQVRGLSRFARQAMADLSSASVSDDAQRIFALNALDLRQSVRPEFVERLNRLSGESGNQVEIDLIQSALTRFDRITDNLVRTDFPFAGPYSVVAELQACIAAMQQTADSMNLRDEMKFPGYLKLLSARQLVKKIRKLIGDLDKLGAPEFERYLDLIVISDYVEAARTCVVEFQNANDNNRRGRIQLRPCVARIKQQTQTLAQLSGSSFRRPVRQITRWAQALSDQDPAQVYFFARKLEGMWEKFETADQIATRRYLRKSKIRLEKILRRIRQFGVRTQAFDGNGEIRQYQRAFDQIQETAKGCSIPPRLLNPGSDGGEQIRVGPFQFVRRRVLAAVYSKALDPDRDEGYMPWADLPVHAAAQTFRDLVSKEQYDYLYEPKDAHKFNMPKLKGNFARRMRNQGVLAFRFVDHVDGAPLTPSSEFLPSEIIQYESRELKNPKVLRVRGVKVIAAGFPDLFPVSPKIPEQLLETWRAPWESKAMDIRSQHQLQAMRVINQARSQAQRDMAHTLARILQSSHSEEALAMRVFQALEATAVDADTRQFLPRDTMYLLRSFKQWFLPDGEDHPQLPGDLADPEDRSLLEM